MSSLVPPNIHLHDELAKSGNDSSAVAETAFGPLNGGRATNGAAVWLEVPYGLPPRRFEDPEPLPTDFRYEAKSYTTESNYAYQPHNDGQQGDTLFEDKVGFGQPTENALFLNIVSPPSFSASSMLPVKVYFHGGFLQFGSPHGLGSQAQYISAERSEVWINIGYRLSAFGFLACDEPRISGNFGFKDQWLALEWVRDNIAAFGGDPQNIQITGLSAGAHSVHQLLHRASRISAGLKCPFQSVILQSNAIVSPAKNLQELRPQYEALCRAVKLDPAASDTLSILQDPLKVSAATICKVIETDEVGTEFGTFRASADGDWITTDPDAMEWQRSGSFAKGLRAAGVTHVIVGDLTEEWYLYSIAHVIKSWSDIVLNLQRYYQPAMVKKILDTYPEAAASSKGDPQKVFGKIFSDWQVHIPVRVLARDLHNAGFPVLRYEIRWTPLQNRTEGYVTHGSDRAIWAVRIPTLEPEQVALAKAWWDRIDTEVSLLLGGKGAGGHSVQELLVLDEDQSLHWAVDDKWGEKMKHFVQ